MQPVFEYFIKMFVCSAILLGYYWFALRNERFHQWNRFYLMAAMLLSIIVPFFHLPIMAREQPTMVITVVSALPWNVVAVKESFHFGWIDALWLTAAIVSVIMLMHLIISVVRIYRMYQQHEHTTFNDVTVVITKEQAAPFSFFKWLFWRQDIDPDSENGKRMLQHELTHISEKHSTDKLFAELLLIFFWMNPFFWIMRRELFAIHEFLADRKAIQQYDGAAFAAMILQAAHPSSTPVLSNPFFTSQLKRRLVMITTSHAPKYSYLRRISSFVLMLMTVSILVLGIEHAQAQKTPKPDKPTKASSPALPGGVPAPDVPPVPTEIQLPDSIRSIQVWDNNGDCMMTYKMKDGRTVKMKMTDAKKNGYPLVVPPPPPPVAPAAASGLAPIHQEHVLPGHPAPTAPAVPGGMPVPAVPATPVPSTGEGKNAGKESLMVIQENGERRDDREPLYIYAGLKITKQQMNEINPDNIASMNVLKGEEATKLYGDAGKNGVIVITPKSSVVTENKDRYAPIVVHGYKKDNPIYILDGKRITDAEMKALLPDEIATINVYKGETAKAKYGEEGKDGVVEISLKDPRGDKGPKGEKGEKEPNKVFTVAETMPSFPGGQDAWRRYLSQTLKYPEKAQATGTQGVSVVKFIVEPDGNLSNLSITKDPGNGLGEEALRLMKMSPKWNPAMQNGQYVRAEVNQTITFRLE